ncbi:MAG: 6-phosphofructokinase [Planctomycetes bacterium]|nr:6-phosphofructokinase [Planctomycetota bacterium]
MSAPVGNALIGQSGGPTAVINQSLVGVIEECLRSERIKGVYGALHGVKGVLNEDMIDLGRESAAVLEGVANTPCAALRSVRMKPTEEDCARMLEVFEAHDIRYFFYIGGNDSAETAHILNEIAVDRSYDVRLFHVPKTIDNDLCVTDHCPGFGSAARFVASALMGDNEDNRSLKGIKIDVIMGRHAGWLTAASTMAKVHDEDGPHLVYVPERAFDLERFGQDVKEVYDSLGRCVIAVSEGIHDAEGKLILESQEKDSHGNVQLSGTGALGDFLASQLKEVLGPKTRIRADTFGYLQRSFADCVSEVDADEAREVGRTAARIATSGEYQHGSIIIRREDDPTYRAAFEVTDLENVAQKTKVLPERYLGEQGHISPEFQAYARPLIGTLKTPMHLSDHPISKRGS